MPYLAMRNKPKNPKIVPPIFGILQQFFVKATS